MELTPLSLLRVASLLCFVAADAGAQATRPAAADFVRPDETATLPPSAAGAVARLAAPGIATHIAALASGGFEGRGLGQPGLHAAAEYVAAMLARAGVPPLPVVAGQTSGSIGPTAAYFWPVPIRAVSDARATLAVEVRKNGGATTRTFRSGIDILAEERAPATWSSGLVFAGYGIRETVPPRDDYRGLDVNGRAVLIFAGVPEGDGWKTPELTRRYASAERRARFEHKVALAQSLGARAVVAIEDEGFPSTLVSGTDGPAGRYFTPYAGAAEQDGAIPVWRVSRAVGDMLLLAAGLSSESARSASSRPVPDVTVSAAVNGDEHLVVSRNVLAVLTGSDQALKHEAVVIGAHMDHLGRTARGVFPGADDNASGTAALLEIAAALAAGHERPKRTIVFAFWTGEEEGHLGSEYYIHHPAWPLDKTVAYLNLDMIGHPWTADEIRTLVATTGLPDAATFLSSVRPEQFFELGLPATAPELEPVLKRVARATNVALHLDWTDGRHGGSDYRAFARKGIPFVRFFGNYFAGYHEPTDTADQVEPAQVLGVARLALGTAWLIADR